MAGNEGYVPPPNATNTPPKAGEIPNGTPPATPPATPLATPPAEGTPPSGLPSDNTPPPEGTPPETFAGFDLNDAQKAQFKDGKYLGRFSNMQDVFDKLKEAEDFKAQHGNTNKNNQQQVENQIAQQQMVDHLLPEFMGNGMELTADMVAKAESVGIDAKDLTIKAYEMREATNKAYEVVGGKERLDTLVAWGKENLPEDVRKEFNAGLGSYGTTKIALEWLESKYNEAEKAGTTTRISGSPSHVGIKPYSDQRELFQDKRYIDSPAGKRDTAAIAQYRARLKATPDNIVYGRQA